MDSIRKLYDWVLSWAEKPTGVRALCGISFAEASFFPIPPDVLLIPLCLSKRNKALYFAILCSIFSILGAAIGYLSVHGYGGQHPMNSRPLQISFFNIFLVLHPMLFQISNPYMISITL